MKEIIKLDFIKIKNVLSVINNVNRMRRQSVRKYLQKNTADEGL